MRIEDAAYAAVLVLLSGCGDLTSTAPVTEAHYDWYASDGMATCAVRNGEGWCRLFDEPEVLEGIEVREFTLGFGHACALAEDGAILCWGNDPLPLGRSGDPAVPAKIEASVRFTGMSTSLWRNCAVAEDGTVWCWGAEFQFGSGLFGWAVPGLPEWCDPGECLLPTAMPAPVRFTSVGMGLSHACGLTRGGEIWCWGRNATGQLGRGDTVEPDGCEGIECGQSPAPIARATRFDALAVTDLGGCGLARNGTAWCWGVGDGTPAAAGDRSFSSITGGVLACGLGEDRVAHCWRAAGADPDPALVAVTNTRPHRVPGFYFDRLFPSAGLSCGTNDVTGVVCWDGLGADPEVVAGQL